VPDKTIIDAVHVTEDFSLQVKVNKIATNYYEWRQGISLCLGMASSIFIARNGQHSQNSVDTHCLTATAKF
jgi:hypothetical protein